MSLSIDKHPCIQSRGLKPRYYDKDLSQIGLGLRLIVSVLVLTFCCSFNHWLHLCVGKIGFFNNQPGRLMHGT